MMTKHEKSKPKTLAGFIIRADGPVMEIGDVPKDDNILNALRELIGCDLIQTVNVTIGGRRYAVISERDAGKTPGLRTTSTYFRGCDPYPLTIGTIVVCRCAHGDWESLDESDVPILLHALRSDKDGLPVLLAGIQEEEEEE